MLLVPGILDLQPVSFIQAFEDMLRYRQQMASHDVGTLFDLCKRRLTLTWLCQATDPRDKMFALQGLTGNLI
jgi:hypothetical protein